MHYEPTKYEFRKYAPKTAHIDKKRLLVAYLIGKLRYRTPKTVITKINQAIKVKIALKIMLAVKTVCKVNPDIKDKDRNNSPIPNNLKTIL